MDKKVYILLSSTGTLLSETIKLYTKAEYNHVSISLDKELTELYSFGRKQPINPLNAGFVKEDIVTGTYSWFPLTDCTIYELSVTKRQFEKIKRLINHFKKSKEQYGYNFIGLFGVVFNKPIEINSMYFCSQFVAEVLKRASVVNFNKPSALVKPHDFEELEGFKKIYEGKLYDYEHLRHAHGLLDYRDFPFRKYMLQQVTNTILNDIKKEHPLSFRDDFLKPKKIQISLKINRWRNN